MKFTLLIAAIAVIVAVAFAADTTTDKTGYWHQHFTEFFKGKEPDVNKLRITPHNVNSQAILEVTVKNGDKLINVDSNDKVHIMFPQWWQTNQNATPFECALHIKDIGVKRATAVWTPPNPADPNQGPILSIAPAETFALDPNAKLAVLCTGLITPNAPPSKKQLDDMHQGAKETKDQDKEQGNRLLVSNDFGLVFINDLETAATIDTVLTLTDELIRPSSSAPFLLTISGIDNEHIKTDKKGNIPDKYNKSICAYAKKLLEVKKCDARNDGLTGVSSTGPTSAMFNLSDPKTYDLQQITSKLIQNPEKYEAFRRFAKELLRLDKLPNITIHNGI